jgi:hypothetical protein
MPPLAKCVVNPSRSYLSAVTNNWIDLCRSMTGDSFGADECCRWIILWWSCQRRAAQVDAIQDALAGGRVRLTNCVVATPTGSGKYNPVLYVPVSDFNVPDLYFGRKWRFKESTLVPNPMLEASAVLHRRPIGGSVLNQVRAPLGRVAFGKRHFGSGYLVGLASGGAKLCRLPWLSVTQVPTLPLTQEGGALDVAPGV